MESFTMENLRWALLWAFGSLYFQNILLGLIIINKFNELQKQ